MKNEYELENNAKNKIRKKRPKLVYSCFADLADVYAKQSQEKGKYVYTSGGGWFQKTAKGERRTAAFFERDRLFSYGSHYLLAKIGLVMNGVEFSVVNFTKYSQTTTGQSYCARNSLAELGQLVVEIKAENKRIDDLTTNRELKEIVIRSLKNQATQLAEQVFSMQFTKYNWGDCRYLKEEIKEHNTLVTKLKMKNLLVKVPDSVFETIKKVLAFNSIRYADIISREQSEIFEF